MTQMHTHEIMERWQVTPQLNVAVDDSGTPVLEIPEGGNTGRIVTLPNISALKEALDRAREYTAIVYPPPASGRPDRNPLDRSLAFTALLECPGFRRVESREGERLVTDFLADWYAQTPFRNMSDYAPVWWSQR